MTETIRTQIHIVNDFLCGGTVHCFCFFFTLFTYNRKARITDFKLYADLFFQSIHCTCKCFIRIRTCNNSCTFPTNCVVLCTTRNGYKLNILTGIHHFLYDTGKQFIGVTLFLINKATGMSTSKTCNSHSVTELICLFSFHWNCCNRIDTTGRRNSCYCFTSAIQRNHTMCT